MSSNSYVWALIKGLAQVRAQKNYQEFNSFDQTISEKAWLDFERSIVKLKEEAQGKPILLALYPTLGDIRTFRKNPSMKLAQRIQDLCKLQNIQFFNTLPEFARHPNPASLYVACDGHWNEAGEQYVARILVKHPIFSLPESSNLK